MILFMFISSNSFSQTGTLLIYDSGDLGIRQFQSFKFSNNPQRQIYIQLNCSNSPPPPNSTGRFIRFNRQNFYWYNPYNNFLSSHWVYEGHNGFWSCNPVGHIAVSKDDSNIVIKHSDEILSDCCGYFQINKVTWDLGTNSDNSIEVPEYSVFCGMDIDTTTNEFIGESVFFYAYKMIYSFDNTVNSIIKVTQFPLFRSHQEITDTIPLLKNYSDGGFLKVNPFNRDYIFVVADKMMLSTTSGTNFFSVNIPPVKKLIFSESDRKVYGYSASKLYSSVNNGISWDSVSLPYDFNVIESNPDSSHVFYAGNEDGLYISRNYGMSWMLYNNSFTFSRNVIGISKDNFSSDSLFVCTDRGVYTVWSSFVVGINNVSAQIPESFSLSQNFPNPFNPVTKIKFDVPSDVRGQMSNVKLTVFDVLGKEVMTLVNEKLSPGSYETEFEGSNFASGIYFYKIEAGNFVETKRMMLLK